MLYACDNCHYLFLRTSEDTCPDCGKEHFIFGESKVEKIAAEHGIEHIARLPIDPVIATMVDAGEVESVSGEHIAPIVDYIEKEI